MLQIDTSDKLGTPMPLEGSQISGLAVELMSRVPVTSECPVASRSPQNSFDLQALHRAESLPSCDHHVCV